MTPPNWTCPRRVGFLFPHTCGRTSPIGCPDCQNGQIADPYAQRTDRLGYDNYEHYDTADWPAAGAMDFTEADGESLMKPGEEFEGDLTAS
jgi:hypothetical protein